MLVCFKTPAVKAWYVQDMKRIALLLFIVALPVYASEEAKIVETVRVMFVALQNDDAGKFRSVTSPDFYAFDVGKRLTGDELIALVKNAHASGKIYLWNVTEPEVHIHGSTAWITYINRGSIEDKSGKQNLNWLESAFFRNENGAWRIHFFHSTRATAD